MNALLKFLPFQQKGETCPEKVGGDEFPTDDRTKMLPDANARTPAYYLANTRDLDRIAAGSQKPTLLRNAVGYVSKIGQTSTEHQHHPLLLIVAVFRPWIELIGSVQQQNTNYPIIKLYEGLQKLSRNESPIWVNEDTFVRTDNRADLAIDLSRYTTSDSFPFMRSQTNAFTDSAAVQRVIDANALRTNNCVPDNPKEDQMRFYDVNEKGIKDVLKQDWIGEQIDSNRYTLQPLALEDKPFSFVFDPQTATRESVTETIQCLLRTKYMDRGFMAHLLLWNLSTMSIYHACWQTRFGQTRNTSRMFEKISECGIHYFMCATAVRLALSGTLAERLGIATNATTEYSVNDIPNMTANETHRFRSAVLVNHLQTVIWTSECAAEPFSFKHSDPNTFRAFALRMKRFAFTASNSNDEEELMLTHPFIPDCLNDWYFADSAKTAIRPSIVDVRTFMQLWYQQVVRQKARILTEWLPSGAVLIGGSTVSAAVYWVLASQRVLMYFWQYFNDHKIYTGVLKSSDARDRLARTFMFLLWREIAEQTESLILRSSYTDYINNADLSTFFTPAPVVDEGVTSTLESNKARLGAINEFNESFRSVLTQIHEAANIMLAYRNIIQVEPKTAIYIFRSNRFEAHLKQFVGYANVINEDGIRRVFNNGRPETILHSGRVMYKFWAKEAIVQEKRRRDVDSKMVTVARSVASSLARPISLVNESHTPADITSKIVGEIVSNSPNATSLPRLGTQQQQQRKLESIQSAVPNAILQAFDACVALGISPAQYLVLACREVLIYNTIRKEFGNVLEKQYNSIETGKTSLILLKRDVESFFVNGIDLEMNRNLLVMINQIHDSSTTINDSRNDEDRRQSIEVSLQTLRQLNTLTISSSDFSTASIEKLNKLTSEATSADAVKQSVDRFFLPAPVDQQKQTAEIDNVIKSREYKNTIRSYILEFNEPQSGYACRGQGIINLTEFNKLLDNTVDTFITPIMNMYSVLTDVSAKVTSHLTQNGNNNNFCLPEQTRKEIRATHSDRMSESAYLLALGADIKCIYEGYLTVTTADGIEKILENLKIDPEFQRTKSAYDALGLNYIGFLQDRHTWLLGLQFYIEVITLYEKLADVYNKLVGVLVDQAQTVSLAIQHIWRAYKLITILTNIFAFNKSPSEFGGGAEGGLYTITLQQQKKVIVMDRIEYIGMVYRYCRTSIEKIVDSPEPLGNLGFLTLRVSDVAVNDAPFYIKTTLVQNPLQSRRQRPPQQQQTTSSSIPPLDQQGLHNLMSSLTIKDDVTKPNDTAKTQRAATIKSENQSNNVQLGSISALLPNSVNTLLSSFSSMTLGTSNKPPAVIITESTTTSQPPTPTPKKLFVPALQPSAEFETLERQEPQRSVKISTMLGYLAQLVDSKIGLRLMNNNPELSELLNRILNGWRRLNIEDVGVKQVFLLSYYQLNSNNNLEYKFFQKFPQLKDEPFNVADKLERAEIFYIWLNASVIFEFHKRNKSAVDLRKTLGEANYKLSDNILRALQVNQEMYLTINLQYAFQLLHNFLDTLPQTAGLNDILLALRTLFLNNNKESNKDYIKNRHPSFHRFIDTLLGEQNQSFAEGYAIVLSYWTPATSMRFLSSVVFDSSFSSPDGNEETTKALRDTALTAKFVATHIGNLGAGRTNDVDHGKYRQENLDTTGVNFMNGLIVAKLATIIHKIGNLPRRNDANDEVWKEYIKTITNNGVANVLLRLKEESYRSESTLIDLLEIVANEEEASNALTDVFMANFTHINGYQQSFVVDDNNTKYEWSQ